MESDLKFTICVDRDPMWRQSESNDFGVGGSLVDLAYFFGKGSNFSFTIQSVLDNWIVEMFTDNCDMVIGLYALYPQLTEHFLYSSPITSAKVLILSRAPKEESYATGIDVNYQVISVLAITIAVMAVLTSGAEKISRKLQNCAKFDGASKLSFWKSLWVYYSSIFIEACPVSLMTESSRLLMTSWLVFLTIMLSLIGGTMKAERTLSRDSAINSLDDILKYPKLSVVIADQSPVLKYFVNSKYTAATAVYKRIKEGNSKVLYGELDRQIPDVVKGKSVMIQDEIYFLPVLNSYYKESSAISSGQLHLSNEEIFLVHCPIFFSKESEIPKGILEIANQKVTYFAATSQMTPHSRYLLQSVEKFLEKQRPEIRINVGFLFCVWAAAMSLCASAVLAEIVYHKWHSAFYS